MPTHLIVLWSLFGVLIVACLAIDLGLGAKRKGAISLRAAAIWSVAWISLAGLFAAVIWVYPPESFAGRGHDAALLFVTGYLVEKALSVDNMFVFIMVFSYFSVKEEDQPRVLKWGIFGALLFRAVLIGAGYVLIQRFAWVLYIFAALLVWAAYKMLTHGDEKIHPERNPVLNLARKVFPIVNRYEGHRFIVRENGARHGTALLIVLIVIESTDVVFALDSIPAIFAITQDFFIVFTSNIFAILGLRALFFVLAGVMAMFHYLKVGVAMVLFFIAAKMVFREVATVHHFLTPPVSLGIIGVVLLVSIYASLVRARRDAERAGRPSAGGPRAAEGDPPPA